MVRSPLVWLEEPDPVSSMETARDEDPELSDIREFFDLWLAYELDLDTPTRLAVSSRSRARHLPQMISILDFSSSSCCG
jgi:hypothetical protein